MLKRGILALVLVGGSRLHSAVGEPLEHVDLSKLLDPATRKPTATTASVVQPSSC